ncbi:MAG: oxidoreductase [Anaerolineae bacterium]|nr:MAG: oxidoreductase [Anaerolineae bacterium]
MTKNVRVIQYGLGSIGAATARLVHERSGLELLGAVEIDPAKAAKDVGSIIGLDTPLGFSVAKSIDEIAGQIEADIVVHTTSSFFPEFKPQILEILDAGYDVVSTSEELSFPWMTHREEGTEIDNAAKSAGKTVLGTGVNPGFLMDFLPVSLTGLCKQVEHIDVQRVINASARREQFQVKIGSGLSAEEFEERMNTGRMGHSGLRESAEMIFHSLGKEMVSYESSVEPIIADEIIETEYLSVQAGLVIGLKQVATANTETQEFLKLTFIAALDAEDEQDTITIVGKPRLEITLKGTNGDLATAAISVNAIPRVVEADPGLVTMSDLPIVACRQL